MTAPDRRARLCAILGRTHGAEIPLAALASRLACSEKTVRVDLQQLGAEGWQVSWATPRGRGHTAAVTAIRPGPRRGHHHE